MPYKSRPLLQLWLVLHPGVHPFLLPATVIGHCNSSSSVFQTKTFTSCQVLLLPPLSLPKSPSKEYLQVSLLFPVSRNLSILYPLPRACIPYRYIRRNARPKAKPKYAILFPIYRASLTIYPQLEVALNKNLALAKQRQQEEQEKRLREMKEAARLRMLEQEKEKQQLSVSYPFWVNGANAVADSAFQATPESASPITIKTRVRLFMSFSSSRILIRHHTEAKSELGTLATSTRIAPAG